jgi:hypothetical protein
MNIIAKTARTLAQRFGDPIKNMFRDGHFFRTAEGAVLPERMVYQYHDKFMNPIVAPAELIPPSVLDGAGFGRVYHLRLPKQRVPMAPEEGRICEDCANFRYEAGQAWIRKHGNPLADSPKYMGPRAPRAGDLGLCAASSADCLVSRFWGSVVETEMDRDVDGNLREVPKRDESGAIEYRWKCQDWKDARKTFSTLDPRKDRSRSPLGDING